MINKLWMLVLSVVWISSAITAVLLSAPGVMVAPTVATIVVVAIYAVSGDLNS